MNFNPLLFILLSFFLLSCQNVEKTAEPDSLIPEDKMVEVLVDLAKVDAAISLSFKEYEKRGGDARKLILEKHQIDSLQLVESNAYYADNFKINERIYGKVEAILKKENDSLSALNEKPKKEDEEKEEKSE